MIDEQAKIDVRMKCLEFLMGDGWSWDGAAPLVEEAKIFAAFILGEDTEKPESQVFEGEHE